MLLKFAVRLHFPDGLGLFEIELMDLKLTVRDLIHLILQNEYKMINSHSKKQLAGILDSDPKITCGNKPIGIHNTFERLISNIEVINGQETDVFEIKIQTGA